MVLTGGSVCYRKSELALLSLWIQRLENQDYPLWVGNLPGLEVCKCQGMHCSWQREGKQKLWKGLKSHTKDSFRKTPAFWRPWSTSQLEPRSVNGEAQNARLFIRVHGRPGSFGRWSYQLQTNLPKGHMLEIGSPTEIKQKVLTSQNSVCNRFPTNCWNSPALGYPIMANII